MDGMLSDAREDVGQVGPRIDGVHPACLDDGVHTGGAPAAGVGAAEEIVLSTEINRGAILPALVHFQTESEQLVAGFDESRHGRI
jgi:hypothetical protein